MKIATYSTLVYAALLAIGGLIGFIQAGSEASLWMGGAFALVLALSAYTISKGKRVGLWTSFGASALLLLFFAWRFLLTGAWLPSGAMLLASVLILVISSLYLNCSKCEVGDESAE